MLAYDIGGHRGDDTETYMRLGYKAICIEAAPGLAQKLRERFAPQIREGRCVVLNVAVSDHEGTLPFYVCKEAGIWNSLDKGMATRNNYHAEELQVPAKRLDAIIAEYGKPDLVKVDIEGADKMAVLALTADIAPAQLSFEAETSLDMVVHAYNIGYRRFNIIRQDIWEPVILPKPGQMGHMKWSTRQCLRLKLRGLKQVHGVLRKLKPDREGTHEGVSTGLYKVDSAGPPPSEHKYGWRSFDEVVHDWTCMVYSGMSTSVWHDIHCLKPQPAPPAPALQ